MAKVFTCHATAWAQLAERATAMIDERILDEIARRHRSGSRLVVGLTGSAARRETLWDLGVIAASDRPDRLAVIRTILRASVDPTMVVTPDIISLPAGTTTPRNWTFRNIGAGEAFVRPPLDATSPGYYVLIHNADWFTDESDGYIAGRTQERSLVAVPQLTGLLTAYDLYLDAQVRGASFRMAAIRPGGLLVAAKSFDQPFMRALMLEAFRQGRMGKGWHASLPRYPPRP
jgi:hypothetical protein